MSEERFGNAVYDYAARNEEEISFKTGDKIKLLKYKKEDDWWEGEFDGKTGTFPAAYVEKIKKGNNESKTSAPDVSSDESKPTDSDGEKKHDSSDNKKPNGNSVDDQILIELEKENDMLKKSAETMVSKIAKLETELEESKDEVKKLKDQVSELESKQGGGSSSSNEDAELAKELMKENEALKKEVESLKKEVETLKASSASTKSATTTTKPAEAKPKPAAETKPTPAVESKPAPAAETKPTPAAETKPAPASGGSGVKNNPFLAKDKKPATPTPSSVQDPKAMQSRTSQRNIGVGKFSVKDDVKKAYNEIRSDKAGKNWAIFRYNDAGNEISLAAEGNSNLGEVVSQLQRGERAYAYVRVTAGDHMSKRAKFVFIVWCGDEVPTLKRAKMSTDKVAMKEIIKEVAVEIYAQTAEELQEEVVMNKVRKAGGAAYGVGTRDD